MQLSTGNIIVNYLPDNFDAIYVLKQHNYDIYECQAMFRERENE